MSFPTIDPDTLQKTLSAPPFVVVDGVVNIRDFGGHPTAEPDTRVRSSYLFRSGEPARITETGKEQLKCLGIKKVFDFRSSLEIANYKAKTPVIEGVEFVSAPVSDDEAYDPVGLAARVKRFEADETTAFVALYSRILESGGPAFEKVLLHFRDHPDESCLIHCTAGKDRTGVFAALVLQLLGVDDEIIVNDYVLTTVGLQPALPMLVARFQKEPIFRDNFEAMMKMAGARAETMRAFLDRILKDKYGGPVNYLRTHTELTDEDITQICRNLLVQE
ncbi:hypothetical protein GLOTRDRAFT_72619 [Gloeophyllum trabeum ATCC 11539]|uniref:Tyrosine specific protein phosphatases domain-containing protein n=1 Tax=Gloeophyllum trabeum (strain ATCC 11539 / FP-39264 / Madison 617) TaxID=670483 RepID=S7QER5_GLOTA|nr:uncharacterized protein GLOTRDRAFT_72619 [Gloeophyllum trabeum ATCC 11539]EPQ58311.1 hypothetical protein GLOTRDRAFT_72619 [Gloeophyllum trabeum ATCC 11539]